MYAYSIKYQIVEDHSFSITLLVKDSMINEYILPDRRLLKTGHVFNLIHNYFFIFFIFYLFITLKYH